ncbi:MAG TPA: carotenoid biosynthesis protein [Candidatus Binatia bacterium]|nr:carotenoid biosynthesis protein [Candidatus Binatia bacterium]
MDDLPLLFVKTLLLRPYVFIFLAAFLVIARGLFGWRRTGAFFLAGWITAFLCEFSSTRTGVPFGYYYYTGSTVGQELYIADVPFMDSLSFTFLLFASYCMALVFLLPAVPRSNPHRLYLVLDPSISTAWPSLVLTAAFLMFIDVIIDPVALRGDRWFLGQIYGYPDPGLYFGIPLMNFAGWAVVGFVALSLYFMIDRRLPPRSRITSVTRHVLLGCALYYGVLLFNLSVTFWIGEPLLGLVGLMMYVPVTILLTLRLLNRLPGPVLSPRAFPTQAS